MFAFESRGQIEVKGKGLMQTWFVEEPTAGVRSTVRA